MDRDLDLNKEVMKIKDKISPLAIYVESRAAILSCHMPSVPLLGHRIEEGRYRFTTTHHMEDQKQLIIGDDQGVIQVVNMETGEHLHNFNMHTKPVTALAVTSDGEYLVSADWGHDAVVWDLRNNRLKHILKGHQDSVRDICIIKNNKYAATVSEDQTCCIWDIARGVLVNRITGHSEWINSVCAYGNVLITASEDRTIRFWKFCWNKERCKCDKILHMPASIRSLSLSDDGTFIAAASGRRIWILSLSATDKYKCLGILGIKDTITSLFLASEYLIVADCRRMVHFFDYRDLKCIHVLKDIPGVVSHIRSLERGRILIFAFADRVSFWDFEKKKWLGAKHHVSDGFMWSTTPEKDAVEGRFWTDRTDLITVFEQHSNGKEKVSGQQRENYILGLNNQKKVMKLMNGYQNQEIDDSGLKRIYLIPMTLAG